MSGCVCHGILVQLICMYMLWHPSSVYATVQMTGQAAPTAVKGATDKDSQDNALATSLNPVATLDHLLGAQPSKDLAALNHPKDIGKGDLRFTKAGNTGSLNLQKEPNPISAGLAQMSELATKTKVRSTTTVMTAWDTMKMKATRKSSIRNLQSNLRAHQIAT